MHELATPERFSVRLALLALVLWFSSLTSVEATPEARELLLAAAPQEASAPAPDESVAAEEQRSAPPVAQRANAFKQPVRFRSKGQAKALMFKFNRDLKILMSPVKKEGKFSAVAATVQDLAHGGKPVTGVLELTRSGTLRAHSPQLVNVSNIVAIDPVIRAELLKSEGPFTAKGQIETNGTVRIVDFSHRRVGDVADDGSMQVESTTTSLDGKVKMVTVSTLAPDGLPWLADTNGTIKKGPVNINVKIRLTRENVSPRPMGD